MSLRRRILEPVVVLSVFGVLAAVMISHAALKSFDSAQEEEARAHAAWLHVQKIDTVVVDFDALIHDVVSFNRFVPPDEVAADYEALTQTLNASIDEMYRLAGDGEIAELTSNLEFEATVLAGEAAAVLGIRYSRAMPTRAYLDQRLRLIRAALEQLDAAVLARKAASVSQARRQFVSQVSTVLGGLLLVFCATAVFSSGRANRLVRALTRLSEAMDTIRAANLNTPVPHTDRRDEIGAMARNVAGFAAGLRELTAAKARIEHMALHDPLTQLPNRRALETRLTELIASDGALAVLHIDLDRFKSVNDTYGHAAGDEVLRAAARAMRSAARSTDMVARLGGDEFVMLLSGCRSADVATRIAERVAEAIKRPIAFADAQIHVGASIGIAFADGVDDDIERLLSNADIALYDAKDAGRDRVAVYDASRRAKAERKNWVLRELRGALTNGEICAFFQPQIDARRGDVIGFEALARWRHPERGVLGPGQFLDVAFDSGHGDEMTRVSVRCAIEALERWRVEGLSTPRISVNLAADQLRNGAMIDEMLSMVRDAGLTPSSIAIEVLESVFFGDDDEPAINQIKRLRAEGVRVELDDFGSGHASISNLRRFEIDRIKIDRAFVTGAHQDSELQAILSALINLAGSLRIECLAEGVETPEDEALLMRFGCVLMQGYGVSRPLPLDDATAWLKAASRAGARVVTPPSPLRPTGS